MISWPVSACADYDPDIWYRTEDEAYATSICRTCPGQDACLTYALEGARAGDDALRYGVWGGLTARQRNSLHRYAVVTSGELNGSEVQVKCLA